MKGSGLSIIALKDAYHEGKWQWTGQGISGE